jgi:hypothetical protein
MALEKYIFKKLTKNKAAPDEEVRADFLLFPSGIGHESLEKSGNFPAEILLPCSSDFRCFPAGYDDFPAPFLPVPVKSDYFRRPKSSIRGTYLLHV